ncbi:hypothetical protein QP62_00150, partial [Staphylococcus aureus]
RSTRAARPAWSAARNSLTTSPTSEARDEEARPAPAGRPVRRHALRLRLVRRQAAQGAVPHARGGGADQARRRADARLGHDGDRAVPDGAARAGDDSGAGPFGRECGRLCEGRAMGGSAAAPVCPAGRRYHFGARRPAGAE